MSKRSNHDYLAKMFVEDGRRFSDIVNGFLFKGKQVVLSEDILEKNSEILSSFGISNGKNIILKKYRDIFRKISLKSDGKAIYALVGIENQQFIDYGMAVRAMMYDALAYSTQIRKLLKQKRQGVTFASKKARRSDKNARQNDVGEYLYGLGKDDELLPVVTIVIYWGKDRWKGPRSLHELLVWTKCPELLKVIPDYRFLLLEPGRMTDKELSQFMTDVRCVFECIRYSSDKKKLSRIIHQYSERWLLDPETVQFINCCTGSKFCIENKHPEEKTNMCKAIDDMVNDGYQKGKREGFREGKKSGFSEGKKTGFSEGKKTGFSEGKKSGFSEGKKSGFSEGKKTGFSEGKKSGFIKGEKSGISKSKKAVAQSMKALGYSKDQIKQIISSMCEAEVLSV